MRQYGPVVHVSGEVELANRHIDEVEQGLPLRVECRRSDDGLHAPDSRVDLDWCRGLVAQHTKDELCFVVCKAHWLFHIGTILNDLKAADLWIVKVVYFEGLHREVREDEHFET